MAITSFVCPGSDFVRLAFLSVAVLIVGACGEDIDLRSETTKRAGDALSGEVVSGELGLGHFESSIDVDMEACRRKNAEAAFKSLHELFLSEWLLRFESI